VDEDGNSATLCGNGYPRFDSGWVTLEESPTITADCLYHEEVNGMIGDPICFDHITVSDENAEVQSQKPKDGQMSILVGDGFNGKWCQQDVTTLPTCVTGALEQTTDTFELLMERLLIQKESDA